MMNMMTRKKVNYLKLPPLFQRWALGPKGNFCRPINFCNASTTSFIKFKVGNLTSNIQSSNQGHGTQNFKYDIFHLPVDTSDEVDVVLQRNARTQSPAFAELKNFKPDKNVLKLQP